MRMVHFPKGHKLQAEQHAKGKRKNKWIDNFITELEKDLHKPTNKYIEIEQTQTQTHMCAAYW